jgi:hypothetical protein
MVWDGRASELLEAGRIWSGALRPGAVIQTWKDYKDYIRVLNGEAPRGIGHSFFLHRYVYDGSGISGMKVGSPPGPKLRRARDTSYPGG